MKQRKPPMRLHSQVVQTGAMAMDSIQITGQQMATPRLMTETLPTKPSGVNSRNLMDLPSMLRVQVAGVREVVPEHMVNRIFSLEVQHVTCELREKTSVKRFFRCDCCIKISKKISDLNHSKIGKNELPVL